MKKQLAVWALIAAGCFSAVTVNAGDAGTRGTNAAVAAANKIQYKIYRENGQYVGTVAVNSTAGLAAFAKGLGAGSYLAVGSVSTGATTERRIIVYQSLTADRRIIVY